MQAAPASPPALPGASEATTYPSYRLAATTAVMGLLVAAAVAVLCSGQHLLTFSGQAWLPLLRLGPAADAEHPQPPGGPLELVRPTCKSALGGGVPLQGWVASSLQVTLTACLHHSMLTHGCPQNMPTLSTLETHRPALQHDKC